MNDPLSSKKPITRRRLFRFSLRALLLITAAIAVWLGVQVNKAHKQRAAVAAIEEAGGSVRYDWMQDYYERQLESNKWLTWTAMYGGAEQRPYPWLRSLVGDEYFQTVIEVELFGGELNEKHREALNHLDDLPNVKHLFLREMSVNDGDLIQIRGLTTVTNLVIESPHVTDAGIRHLAGLANLEVLELGGTSATDRSLPVLKTVKQLKQLGVPSGISQAGRAELEAEFPDAVIWSDTGKVEGGW